NSLRVFSAAIASFFCALFEAFRSSEALPNENALRSLDFPGPLVSLAAISARRCVAGLCVSPGGEGRSLRVALGVGGLEVSESAVIGWDRCDGLFTRFESSVFGAFVDDDESPSRI